MNLRCVNFVFLNAFFVCYLFTFVYLTIKMRILPKTNLLCLLYSASFFFKLNRNTSNVSCEYNTVYETVKLSRIPSCCKSQMLH